ncbi:sensor histidine kinase [Brevirhabdus sp.]|uniref:sensor histidine kinase n=1 Tax=Brevirhabdus sp. TaxID=2004514 RepID=UPI0040593FD3
MPEAAPHPRQDDRLNALLAFDILDTPSEREFDDIASLAAVICQAPIALISFVDRDRQWFKSHIGLDVDETPLNKSVCAHAILQDEMLIIPDVTQDPRTRDNPLIADVDVSMRFYAGMPLLDESGLPLGTLCILDRVPRDLDTRQREALGLLARQVSRELKMRKTLAETRHIARELKEKSETLTQALEMQQTLKEEIDHRVKNSLQLVASLINMQAARNANADVKKALTQAVSRVRAISSVHAELNASTHSDKVLLEAYLARLMQDLGASAPDHVKIQVSAGNEFTVSTEQATSIAIITNEFVTNSLKYAFPAGRSGTVNLSMTDAGDGMLRLLWCDDGIGAQTDEAGRPVGDTSADGGSGLGMQIISAVAQQLDARIVFDYSANGTSLSMEFKPAHGAR